MSNLEIAIPLPVNASADVLDRSCFCRTLDKNLLRKSLESDASIAGMMQMQPQLFSSTVVFIADEIARRITAIVAAIGRVTALPMYQTIALSRAPAIAQRAFGPVGVCMGFDFHLGAAGWRLIVINTNAGGALLNAALARAQQSCCEAMDWAFSGNARAVSIEQTLFEMFIAEWRLQRADTRLRSVLIVDDDPASQYLATEFSLFQQMFRHHGVVAHIAAAIEVEWRDNKLWHKGEQVDMIYNRLTDFVKTICISLKGDRDVDSKRAGTQTA